MIDAKQHKTKSWSYLLRVLLSFVLTVLLLDLFWSALSQSQNEKSIEHYWQDAFLLSLKESISNTNPAEFSALAEDFSQKLGVDVFIDPLDQIHLEDSNITRKTSALVEISGDTFLLSTYPDQQVQIRVGPIPEDNKPWLSSLITLGFYALVAALIWVWIRPLTNGLDQLSEATQKFAHNYQEPLPELDLKSPVKELAKSIDSMAEDIRALIQTQIELTGGLSHEIRTPLARIKFALATARSRVGEQSQFESIEQDIDELEQLVEAMLDYSRLQQTQEAMHWQTMDASKSLEELASKFRWRTSADITVASEPSLSIEADSRLMPLAVSNLLANATRYAESSIQIGFWINNERQFISIADDGPGIAKEKREQAMLPFKKNASANDQSEGFGLGLAIVNRIAKLHDGEIMLDESVGGGLTVTITWPTSAKPQENS